ncbi:MAG: hypothetical protein QOF64_2874 [Candidatus Binatota bacterium]|jgi:4-hydroxy-3-polyprenylbenzoate decarboxylase|nr:hypothetical protein [Candidatus Binatota bacterium]
MLVHLRDECRITSVLRVEMYEPLTSTYKLVIIQIRRPNEADVWRALHAACSFHPGVGKIVVVVDEDIDPSNEAAVFWAMCYRMKPHKDVHIVPGMEKGHAHSANGATNSIKKPNWRCKDATLKRARS